MARTMEEVRSDFAGLAQDFYDLVHAAKGSPPGARDGDVRAALAGQVITVWLPAHAEPHLAADLRRFIDAQCEQAGITIPVLVTVAAAVAVSDG